MRHFTEYNGHIPKLIGERKAYDNTIMTFDIETSSYLILDGKQLPASEYLKLTKEEQERAIYQSCMYIWMFSIDGIVYYGRTWSELDSFLYRIQYFSDRGKNIKHIVHVHNLPFEFQAMRNYFEFEDVFARKSRKPMRFKLKKYNFEFRDTLIMTNAKLEKLPELYLLNTQKLVGDLDYDLIRNSKTPLTEKEMKYCENDCLILHEYIQRELDRYDNFKSIPMTQTGQVRKELKGVVNKSWRYLWKTRRSVSNDGHIYNLLISAFMGGYTHSNWTKTNKIIKNVTSYDFCSSYPFCMISEKYPMTEFKKCNITKKEQILSNLAYIIVVRFKNIKCKYINNFISQSKCTKISHGRYDNGRVISADEIEMVLTDVDFKLIDMTYSFESYEFLEVYWSIYDYLPDEYINFVLDKYEDKTKLKGIEGKELEYQISKQKVNSLYGMCVTNNIRDRVVFDNVKGWYEEKLSNKQIEEALKHSKTKGFLSFQWGVWITAHARYNLISNLIKQDRKVIYADTDSLKLEEGFDESLIKAYNIEVVNKLKKVSHDLGINVKRFAPEDKNGERHILGIFEKDGEYEEFITQGAKKYAYKQGGEIHITVSGIPKKRSKSTKKP